jgi:hypothetical protein
MGRKLFFQKYQQISEVWKSYEAKTHKIRLLANNKEAKKDLSYTEKGRGFTKPTTRLFNCYISKSKECYWNWTPHTGN